MRAPTKPQKNNEPLLLDPGRRRSMRVLLSVPITVSRKIASNQDFQEETRTLVVNAHGSFGFAGRARSRRQEITLSNKATQHILRMPHRVRGRRQAGRAQMGVEFVKPSPPSGRSIFRRTTGSFPKTNRKINSRSCFANHRFRRSPVSPIRSHQGAAASSTRTLPTGISARTNTGVRAALCANQARNSCAALLSRARTDEWKFSWPGNSVRRPPRLIRRGHLARAHLV